MRPARYAAKGLKRVTVDTTVQPKAITFPTDAKLLHAAIKELIVTNNRRAPGKLFVPPAKAMSDNPYDGHTPCGRR